MSTKTVDEALQKRINALGKRMAKIEEYRVRWAKNPQSLDQSQLEAMQNDHSEILLNELNGLKAKVESQDCETAKASDTDATDPSDDRRDEDARVISAFLRFVALCYQDVGANTDLLSAIHSVLQLIYGGDDAGVAAIKNLWQGSPNLVHGEYSYAAIKRLSLDAISHRQIGFKGSRTERLSPVVEDTVAKTALSKPVVKEARLSSQQDTATIHASGQQAGASSIRAPAAEKKLLSIPEPVLNMPDRTNTGSVRPRKGSTRATSPESRPKPPPKIEDPDGDFVVVQSKRKPPAVDRDIPTHQGDRRKGDSSRQRGGRREKSVTRNQNQLPS